MKRTLIILVGYQGSGKSTLAKALSNYLECHFIETSDVVKALHDVPREELPSTAKKTEDDPNWLVNELEKELKAAFEDKGIAVLSGVREPIVVKKLQKKFPTAVFEITAHPELRYERLMKLGKIKDAEGFIEHELREKEMGLEKIMKNAPFTIPTSEDTSPTGIASAVTKKLKEKGYKWT